MTRDTFRAMVVSEEADGSFLKTITKRTLSPLGAGEVRVKVHYSSLNYKDALSATGNRGVTRKYPHTPGIDAAGVVEESNDGTLDVGSEVIVTSYDLGMNTPGGFSEYITVPGSWVVPAREGLSLKESMILGTAGFTAAMSVDALVRSVPPDAGDVLVTGATGGVGSIAVALLAKLGYSVVAVSGKDGVKPFLQDLGAKQVINRASATEGVERPLMKPRWSGVIDTVGGDILVAAIKSTSPLGVVTCCGNVASPELNANVFPFILRGVSLVGIDSQNCPIDYRKEIWSKLAGDWKLDKLQAISREVPLEEVDSEISLILSGKQKGRVVVNVLK